MGEGRAGERNGEREGRGENRRLRKVRRQGKGR